MPLLGRHNVMNALAGIAVGLEAGITPSEAAASLASLQAPDKRGQIVEIGGATLINDCYNSNPKALEAMVDVVAGSPGKRRIVVAGEHEVARPHPGDYGQADQNPDWNDDAQAALDVETCGVH